MDDRALVERQLGRPPRAFLRVAARCPFGAPAVTEQAPYDDAGDPFPTTYYLTCPQLVAAIARLEAAGGVERWSAELERDPDLAADLERATERAAAAPPGARGRADAAATAAPRSSSGSAAAPTRAGSSACTPTPPTRSPTRATCSASASSPRSTRSGRRNAAVLLSRIRPCVVTEAEVESARREWEDGHRRLLEQARRRAHARPAAGAGRRRRRRAAAAGRRRLHARASWPRRTPARRSGAARSSRSRLRRRAGRGRSRSSRRPHSTSTRAARRTTSRDDRPERRPGDAAQRNPLWRPALDASSACCVALLLGVSLGRALEDGPVAGRHADERPHPEAAAAAAGAAHRHGHRHDGLRTAAYSRFQLAAGLGRFVVRWRIRAAGAVRRRSRNG